MSGCIPLISMCGLLLLFNVAPHWCDHIITTDLLPYISRVPCSDAKEQCSLEAFANDSLKSNSSNFLKTWMLALYFDLEKYSSHDIVSEVLPGYLSRKLFQHRIMVGRVRCNQWSGQHEGIASLCDSMDPSIIYAYIDGKKSNYWWSVSDLLSHRAFVLGNILTLQYKHQLDMFTATNHMEKLKRLWNTIQAERKFLLAVHVVSADLEVNTTDRVKAFDLMGLLIRNVPHLRVVVITGVIERGIEFRWYDSVACPRIEDSTCRGLKLEMEDVESHTTDELMCEIERFSNGMEINEHLIRLRPNSAIAGEADSIRRLLRACPFVLMVYEDEPPPQIKEELGRISPDTEQLEVITVTTPRELARKALTSLGAEPDLATHNVLFKLHSETVNETLTAFYSRLTSPSGFTLVFRPYGGKVNRVDISTALDQNIRKFHSGDDYDQEDTEYNPYIDNDELMLLWNSQKAAKSEHLAALNASTFGDVAAGRRSPAVVLFYQPWSPASLYSRDVVFPGAANFLSRLGVGDRLFSLNCFDYNEVCQREAVTRYPLVKTFVGGKARIYTDTIALPDMVREALLLGKNFVYRPKSKLALGRMLNYTRSVLDQVILAVDIEDKKTIERIRSAAEHFGGKELFVVCSRKDLPKKLRKEVPEGTIVSYSARLKPHLIALREANLDTALNDFVLNSHYGRVMELNWAMYQQIASSRRPLLTLLVHQMTPALHCLLAGIVTERPDQLYVTWMHARKQQDIIIFKDFRSPELVLRDPVKGVFHRYAVNASRLRPAPDCARTEAAVARWLDDIFAGRRPADEVITERQYPPTGPHLNMRDDVYPPPRPAQPREAPGREPEAEAAVEVGSPASVAADQATSAATVEDEVDVDRGMAVADQAQLGASNIGATGLGHDSEEL